MTRRIWNFNAGPATLPEEVLLQAREDLLSLGELGVGILEVGHRGPEFLDILERAEASLRRLLGAGQEWAVLFLPGGASLQFAMVPWNLGPGGDYVLTGVWSKKALAEARKLGPATVAGSSEETAFDRIPSGLTPRADAAFLHYTSNNTIHGTQWREPPVGPAPLVCDASSDILAAPLDLERHALVYAGAQKNLGAAGVSVVLIRRELLARSRAELPSMLSYAVHAEHRSLYNTPPVFAIHVVGLMLAWAERQGGLPALAAASAAKAARLYACLDAWPELYRGLSRPEDRSRVNVTFRLPSPALEDELLAAASAAGCYGLQGHRALGGLRASLYNALPERAVEDLVALLEDFARRRA